MIFLFHLRLRSLLIVAGIVVGGMLLLHPEAHADPVATTTAVEAQADPIWVENGITAVGQDVPAQWLDRTFWDTPHTFTTPGEIHPNLTGRALTFGGFRHEFNGTLISTVTMDPSSHKVTEFKPGNPAPVQCPTATPCQGLGAGRAMGSDITLDPFAWMAGKFGEAAKSVLGWSIKDAAHALKPDLSAAWWVDAYQKSYGAAIICWLFIIACRIGAGTRKGESGAEWVNDVGLWSYGFFAAATLGPVIGQMVIDGMAGLADNIANSTGGSGALAGLQTIVDAVDRTTTSNGSAVGGSFIAMIIMFVVFLGAVATVIVLVASTSIVYLSSALFLIGFAWITSEKYRHGAFRAVRTFTVMVASKPLLVFILGMGVNLMGGSVVSAGVPQDVATLLVGAVVLLSAAAAPSLVWHYAGVKDGGNGQMPGGQATGMVTMGAGRRATSMLIGRR